MYNNQRKYDPYSSTYIMRYWPTRNNPLGFDKLTTMQGNYHRNLKDRIAPVHWLNKY